MNDARQKMQFEVKNEAYGIPRVTGAPGHDFSLNMGTNNFTSNAYTDSVSMMFRTNNKLTGLLVNTYA